MGLFKTDNSTHTHEHYHTSTLGALANAYASRKNAQDALRAEVLQAAPEEAKARAEEAKAKAEIEAAKIKAKSDEKMMRKQLKHEEEIRLMETDPEAYRKKQEFKRKLIKYAIIGGVVYFVIAAIVAIIGSATH